jgi:hypothetical protein
MSKRLGPIVVQCDSPPYLIVKATRLVGLCAPEDVRWIRLRHLRGDRPGAGGSWYAPWKLFQRGSQPAGKRCGCGQPLPSLFRATFTFESGETLSFTLGQCARCRTVFWDETCRAG